MSQPHNDNIVILGLYNDINMSLGQPSFTFTGNDNSDIIALLTSIEALLSGGGGGMAIGAPVTGSTDEAILYTKSGNLKQSSNLLFESEKTILVKPQSGFDAMYLFYPSTIGVGFRIENDSIPSIFMGASFNTLGVKLRNVYPHDGLLCIQDIYGTASNVANYPALLRNGKNFDFVNGNNTEYIDGRFKGLALKTSDGRIGSGSMNATPGAVTISNTAVTGSSKIFLQRTNGGTNYGHLYISAQSAGVSFTVTSTDVNDTSNFDFIIIEPF